MKISRNLIILNVIQIRKQDFSSISFIKFSHYNLDLIKTNKENCEL